MFSFSKQTYFKGFLYLLLLSMGMILNSSCNKELFSPMPAKSQIIPKVETKTFPVNGIINFSGYQWLVTNSPKKRKAPGNNFWSSNAVWVDQDGFLHLSLTKDTITGKWFCAEITSVEKFGNGSYQFWIDGRIDRLDKNVVFGLFNYSGIDNYDEIDIEFARWGDANLPNLNYTVYPEEHTKAKIWGSQSEFSLADSYSTHHITRTSSSVKFESMFGLQHITANHFNMQTFSADAISKKEMPIYLNLWSYRGMAPSDDKNVEIIVRKFVFNKAILP